MGPGPDPGPGSPTAWARPLPSLPQRPEVGSAARRAEKCWLSDKLSGLLPHQPNNRPSWVGSRDEWHWAPGSLQVYWSLRRARWRLVGTSKGGAGAARMKRVIATG